MEQNPFILYQSYVSEANLYGYAFFGHSPENPKERKSIRAKLNRLWQKALRTAVKNGNDNIPARYAHYHTKEANKI